MVIYLDNFKCQVLNITSREESLEDYFLRKVGDKNA